MVISIVTNQELVLTKEYNKPVLNPYVSSMGITSELNHSNSKDRCREENVEKMVVVQVRQSRD
jgi:hypothetical protein